jgi:hypothetical protein
MVSMICVQREEVTYVRAAKTGRNNPYTNISGASELGYLTTFKHEMSGRAENKGLVDILKGILSLCTKHKRWFGLGGFGRD